MRPFLAALIGCCILLGPHSASRAEPCPASYLEFCSDLHRSYSAAAIRDSNDWCGLGGYDLTLGHLSATGWGSYVEAGAEDVFKVVGLPVGTPLSFSARLSVSGYARGTYGEFPNEVGGCITIEVWDGINSVRPSACGTYANPLNWTGFYGITIQRAAGEPFTLSYLLRAAGSSRGYAVAEVSLAFDGLPPGARVISCQGYYQDFPVPARSLSWGALKLRYH